MVSSSDEDAPIAPDKQKQHTQIMVTNIPDIGHNHPVVLLSKEQDKILSVWNGDKPKKSKKSDKQENDGDDDEDDQADQDDQDNQDENDDSSNEDRIK